MTACLICASGPSLAKSDIDHFSDRFTIAVNDTYKLIDRVDLLYACDGEWWDHHAEKTQHIKNRWTCSVEASGRHRLRLIPGEHHDNAKIYFNDDRQQFKIIYGGNSGFQAIGLAHKLGFDDVVLLGFDMGHDAGQPKHFFGNHPQGIDRPSPFNMWIDAFNKASPAIKKAGMRIVNASRETRLECFARYQWKE